MYRLLAQFVFNFLICIDVHVLTRSLVLPGVTCLNKGFDLIRYIKINNEFYRTGGTY